MCCIIFIYKNNPFYNIVYTRYLEGRQISIQDKFLRYARWCIKSVMDTQRHAARLAVYKWRTREECIRHSVRQLHYYSDSSPHNGDTLPSFLRFCHGFTVATHDKEPIRGNSTLRERFLSFFFFSLSFAFINATFHRYNGNRWIVKSKLWSKGRFILHVLRNIVYSSAFRGCSKDLIIYICIYFIICVYRNFSFLKRYVIYIAAL